MICGNFDCVWIISEVLVSVAFVCEIIHIGKLCGCLLLYVVVRALPMKRGIVGEILKHALPLVFFL
jgi:hypothetical protein